MRINISTEKGMEKFQKELDIIQAKSKVRNVSAEEIAAAAHKIFLQLGISKKALAGSRVRIDLNAKNLLYCYDSIPQSTIVTLEFSSGHWCVVDVCRDHTHRAGHDVETDLTEEAKEALVDRYSHFAL